MNETQQLVNAITEGIQDKKGKNIVVADLTNIGDTICQYFIICQGNSPSQVQAIAESIGESARLKAHAKPVAADGLRNAEWVAMDYTDIIVNVFLPQTRDFYDIEHLWADAQLTSLPDIDLTHLKNIMNEKENKNKNVFRASRKRNKLPVIISVPT